MSGQSYLQVPEGSHRRKRSLTSDGGSVHDMIHMVQSKADESHAKVGGRTSETPAVKYLAPKSSPANLSEKPKTAEKESKKVKKTKSKGPVAYKYGTYHRAPSAKASVKKAPERYFVLPNKERRDILREQANSTTESPQKRSPMRKKTPKSAGAAPRSRKSVYASPERRPKTTHGSRPVDKANNDTRASPSVVPEDESSGPTLIPTSGASPLAKAGNDADAGDDEDLELSADESGTTTASRHPTTPQSLSQRTKPRSRLSPVKSPRIFGGKKRAKSSPRKKGRAFAKEARIPTSVDPNRLDKVFVEGLRPLKVVHIYLASLRDDMLDERAAFHEIVHPALKSLCNEHGFELSVVDLWASLPEDPSGTRKRAVQQAIHEIRYAQHASPGVHFVFFAGDKYGEPRVPAVIPAQEMALIREHTRRHVNGPLLAKWYVEDKLVVPPVFRLTLGEGSNSRAALYSNVKPTPTSEPSSQKDALVEMLIDTVDLLVSKRLMTHARASTYMSSFLDEQIAEGVFGPRAIPDSCVGVVRTLRGLRTSDKDAYRFADLCSWPSRFPIDSRNQETARKIVVNSHAQNRLGVLLARISGAMNQDDILPYESAWDDGSITRDHLPEMCEDLIETLSAKMKYHFETVETKIRAWDEEHKEEKVEEYGMKHLIQVGPQLPMNLIEDADIQVSTALHDYLNFQAHHPSQEHAIVVAGRKGAGKGAVARAAVEHAQRANSKPLVQIPTSPRELVSFRKPILVARCACSATMSIWNVLQELCNILYSELPQPNEYDLDKDSHARRGNELRDCAQLADDLHRILRSADSTRPVLILVEGIDRVNRYAGHNHVSWIPDPLPPQVRIVITVGVELTHPEPIFRIDEQSTLNSISANTRAVTAYHALVEMLPRESILTLDPLDNAAMTIMLESMLEKDGRRLEKPQIRDIISKCRKMGGHLRCLRLCYIESLNWTSTEFSPLPNSEEALVDRIFGRVAQQYGGNDVLSGFMSIYVAEAPLPVPSSMRDLLLRHDDKWMSLVLGRQWDRKDPFPDAIVRGLATALAPLMMTHTDMYDAMSIRDSAVMEGFFRISTSDNRTLLLRHRHLAEYYCHQPWFQEPGIARTVNHGKVASFGRHQLKGRCWRALQTTLCDPLAVAAYFAAGVGHALIALYTDTILAIRKLGRVEVEERKIMYMWQIVSQMRYQLEHYPFMIFQLLANDSSSPVHVEPFQDLWIKLERTSAPDPIRSVGELAGHTRAITSLVYSPDSSMILSSSLDGTVRLWSTSTLELVRVITTETNNDEIQQCAFSPDGVRIAIVGVVSGLSLYDVISGKKLPAPEIHGTTTCSFCEPVRSVDYEKRRLLRQRQKIMTRRDDFDELSVQAEKALLLCAPALAECKHAASDVTVEDVKQIQEILRHHHIVLPALETVLEAALILVHVQDISEFIYMDPLEFVRLVNDLDKDNINWKTVDALQPYVGRVDFLPDTVSKECPVAGPLCRWVRAVETYHHALGNIKPKLDAQEEAEEELEIASENFDYQDRKIRKLQQLQLIVGTNDGLLVLVNPDTGSVITQVEAYDESVTSAMFSPNRRKLISSSKSGEVLMHDVQTLVKCAEFTGFEGYITEVKYSPSGELLVTAGTDCIVRVWNQNGLEQATCTGHKDWVNAVGFSPDASLVVSGSDDNSVCVWDSHSGARLLVFAGHSTGVSGVCFSSGGLFFASSGFDGLVRFWTVKGETDVGGTSLSHKKHIPPNQSVVAEHKSRAKAGMSSSDQSAPIYRRLKKSLSEVVRGSHSSLPPEALSTDAQPRQSNASRSYYLALCRKERQIREQLDALPPPRKDIIERARKEARDALNLLADIPSQDLSTLANTYKPQNLVMLVMEATCILLGEPGHKWHHASALLQRGNFAQILHEFDLTSVRAATIKQIERYATSQDIKTAMYEQNAMPLAASLCAKWVVSVYDYHVSQEDTRLAEDRLKAINGYLEEVHSERLETEKRIDRFSSETRLNSSNAVRSIAIAPQDQLVFTAHRDHAKVAYLNSWKRISTHSLAHPVSSVAIAARKEYVAVATAHEVAFLDGHLGKSLKTLPHMAGHTEPVIWCSFKDSSPEVKALSAAETTIRVHDPNSGVSTTLHDFDREVVAVAADISVSVILVATAKIPSQPSLSFLRIDDDLNLSDHPAHLSHESMHHPLSSVAVLSDGQLGAAGDAQGTLFVWCLMSRRLKYKLTGITDQVVASTLFYSADATLAVAFSSDTPLFMWNLSANTLDRDQDGNSGDVTAPELSPASVYSNGTDGFTSMAFESAKALLYVGNRDGTILELAVREGTYRLRGESHQSSHRGWEEEV